LDEGECLAKQGRVMGFGISGAVRESLFALSDISNQLAAAQKRVATGKKVNEAADDPAAFFAASALTSRAAALNNLMAGISSGTSLISAANSGLTQIQSLINSAQSVANQALQSTASATVSITGTRTGLTTGTTIATNSGNSTNFKAGDTFTVSDGTTTATYTAVNGDTVQTVLNAINGTANLKATASLSNGALVIAATQKQISLTIGGTINGAGGGTLSSITGFTAGTTGYVTNTTRQSLATQFDNIRAQVDLAAQDASYNGQNLLTGSSASIPFNESGSSKLTIAGTTATSAVLGLSATTNQWQNDSDINTALTNISTALAQLQAQTSVFSSNLGIVQARQTFTRSLIDILNTGADNLTASDANEDGALVLALLARQQLASTTLAMAANRASDVLRMFGAV
jgi:flagellin